MATSENISTTVNDPTNLELLTVEQAAGYLQLSTSSIRSYIRQGKLKAFRIAGLRKVLIPRSELIVLLEPTGPQGESTE
jgi:excisionase family DNA binding protein